MSHPEQDAYMPSPQTVAITLLQRRLASLEAWRQAQQARQHREELGAKQAEGHSCAAVSRLQALEAETALPSGHALKTAMRQRDDAQKELAQARQDNVDQSETIGRLSRENADLRLEETRQVVRMEQERSINTELRERECAYAKERFDLVYEVETAKSVLNEHIRMQTQDDPEKWKERFEREAQLNGRVMQASNDLREYNAKLKRKLDAMEAAEKKRCQTAIQRLIDLANEPRLQTEVLHADAARATVAAENAQLKADAELGALVRGMPDKSSITNDRGFLEYRHRGTCPDLCRDAEALLDCMKHRQKG